MKILNTLTPCRNGTAVALGFFDGVHLGHKAVISGAVRCAKENSLSSVVFTFEKSPASVLSGVSKPVITDSHRKCMYIEQLGTDILYMVPFEQVKNLSCEDFIYEILYKTLNAKYVFCGFNYRFGKGGSGDIVKLSEICSKYDISVTEISPVLYKGLAISSTRIRNAVSDGDTVSANAMLGHKFGFDFEVVRGNSLGKKLGFPTLNQKLPEDFIKPMYGVYASAFVSNGTILPAVTNIGIKPTVGGHTPLAETWVIGHDLGDLYNKKAEILLLDFIRPEKKFDNIQQLKDTVLENGRTAEEIFKRFFAKNKGLSINDERK